MLFILDCHYMVYVVTVEINPWFGLLLLQDKSDPSENAQLEFVS